MFYLFILESIGTSELMLIGLVALIVFGPRKLPELARMLGKAMNEFRRSTDEFKRTWEREVDFENEGANQQIKPATTLISEDVQRENSLQENANQLPNEIVAPEIKEISGVDLRENFSDQTEASSTSPKPENVTTTNKRDWL